MTRRILVALTCSLSFSVGAHAQTSPETPAPATKKTPTTKAPDDPWAGRSDLLAPPIIKMSTKVDLGAVERYTLPNGLQVVAVPRHSTPVIDLALAFRIDDSAEALGKAGVANFTTGMLRKGTKKRTADQISEAIDFVGGDLDADTIDGGAFVDCRARSKDMGLCFDLVTDITQRPAFPANEMGEVRDQLIAAVDASRDQASFLAKMHAENLYFGDSDPRGRAFSKRTINGVSRADLLAFYDLWFRPNNAVLAISGDFDPKALRAQLTKWFGGWKRGDVLRSLHRPLPPLAPLAVRLVDKPDQTQTEIAILGPGVRHAAPDLCATRLMNYTLGGGAFSSRLVKVVRSENAKTYGARSEFHALRDDGVFQATTFTRAPETANTVKLVLGEIERMRTGGVTDAELTAAKANMIGGYGLKFETGEDVARQLITVSLDDLPADYATTYPSCLDRVTLADVANAARDHLHPQALVVVGNAKIVRPLLDKAKLKPTETVEYTEPVSAAERWAAAQEKEKARAGGEGTPAEQAEGKRLLDLAIAKKGGTPDKVKTLHVVASGTMSMSGQQAPIKLEGWYDVAHGQREDVAVMGQVMSQIVYDGKAVMKIGAMQKDAPPELAAEMRRELFRNPYIVLYNAARATGKVRARGKVTDPKGTFDGLTVTSPDGDRAELLLDPTTHELAAIVTTEDNKTSRTLLSDYKIVGGIAFPHKLVSEDDGQKIELVVEKIDVNPTFPKGTF